MPSSQIVAVRLSGGNEHRHIAGVCYVTTTATPFSANTAGIEAILEKLDGGYHFFVRDENGETVQVVAVRSTDGARYIRTKKEGVLSDNLLRLPRYKRD